MSTAGAPRDAPPARPSYGARDLEPGPAQGGRAGTEPAQDALARSLEPGPLRDELLGPSGAPAPAADAAPGRVAPLRFTGEGGEYFRIWIVNLLLTVATLGIYSAWAKVRRTRYFWQNTRLEGHAFDFHGRPMAILAGRIVALLLLAGYSFAFEFSSRAGLALLGVMRYGREFEHEADAFALALLQAEGRSPHALDAMFARMDEARKDRGSIPDFLSTHPSTDGRRRRLGEARAQSPAPASAR